MQRQAFVDVSMVRAQQVENAAILSEDTVDE